MDLEFRNCAYLAMQVMRSCGHLESMHIIGKIWCIELAAAAPYSFCTEGGDEGRLVEFTVLCDYIVVDALGISKLSICAGLFYVFVV